MKKPNLAFIGAGNMCASLIGGLITNGYDPSAIWASNPSTDKLTTLRQRYHIKTTTDNKEAAAAADIVVFAVKPDVLLEVLKEVAVNIRQHRPLVLSVVTGIKIITISNILAEDIPVVRCMPNTPALLNTGATALFANQFVSEEQRELAESIMRSVGITVWLEQEELLDVVTALSGSGPAYFFFLMEMLEEIGMKFGLTQSTAHLLVIQTALGAAQMAMQSEMNCMQLRKGVTSPGGTTERAISTLIDGKIKELVSKAVTAAKQRAEELGNEY